MIVLDASAVPDFPSGARTRLRGLLGGYARLGDAPRVTVLIGRGGSLLDGVALGSIEIEPVERPGGPFARIWSRRRKAVRAARLWHSETIPPLAPTGVPALLTLHDLRWNEPRSVSGEPLARWLPRHLAARAWLPRLARSLTGIVTVSESSARAIETELGVARDRIAVVSDATRPDSPGSRLEPMAADEVRRRLTALGVAGRPYFLALGQLEPRKGLELAMAALPARATLVLAGEGPARAALAALSRRMGLAGGSDRVERVVFTGRVSERDGAALLDGAHALLLPSRIEGFGFTPHEARVRGVPVIASDLPALRETLAVDAGVQLLERTPSAWGAALAALDLAAAPRRISAPSAGTTWRDSALALADLYRRRSLPLG